MYIYAFFNEVLLFYCPHSGLLDLPTTPLIVTPQPPSLKAAVLTRRSKKLVVQFSKRISMHSECGKLFEDMKPFGESEFFWQKKNLKKVCK